MASRLDEVRTEEKVEAKGEVTDVESEELSLRDGEPSAAGAPRLVESGVRPRRELEVWVGRPQADCWGLLDNLAPGALLVLEANEF